MISVNHYIFLINRLFGRSTEGGEEKAGHRTLSLLKRAKNTSCLVS